MIRYFANRAIKSLRRGDWYDQDGLTTMHNHDFMREPRFRAAYERGMKAAGEDYAIHWRVHTALWVASNALSLPGDYVECGVNRGALSSAIMQYLDWNRTGGTRRFFLLDTFGGLDPEQITDADRALLEKSRAKVQTGYYESNADRVRRNFEEWKNVRMIVGAVPGTLAQVDTNQVAYLHLDMNHAPPEVAAAEHFWPLLAPGAMILLDDYAYIGYGPQKTAHDAFAQSKGVTVLTLPTGQGLIQKPHAQ